VGRSWCRDPARVPGKILKLISDTAPKGDGQRGRGGAHGDRPVGGGGGGGTETGGPEAGPLLDCSGSTFLSSSSPISEAFQLRSFVLLVTCR
jgi:hypothetical protein